jgi:hypothetical protein
MSRVKIWTRVPDQSNLRVKVEGGTGTAEGFLTVSDGTNRQIPDNVLRGGTSPINLRSPKLYSLTLVLTFADASTMTVKGHVERPDGSHQSGDVQEPVTGAAGDVKTVALGVITLQGRGR